MSITQATHTVTLERRTDIDLESYRRVAREGAGIVIGDGASERMGAALHELACGEPDRHQGHAPQRLLPERRTLGAHERRE